jgi:hypothetical protein
MSQHPRHDRIDAVLAKPFRPDELKMILSRLAPTPIIHSEAA